MTREALAGFTKRGWTIGRRSLEIHYFQSFRGLLPESESAIRVECTICAPPTVEFSATDLIPANWDPPPL